MRKTGVPWFRTSHNGWYVCFQGRQVLLAKGKKNRGEAFAKLSELLGTKPPEQSVPEVAPAPPELTVEVLVREYRVALKKRVSEGTFVAYGCILDPFCKKFPETDVRKLKPEDVLDWVNGKEWSQTTRRYALTVIGSVLRWGMRTKKISENPLAEMKRPSGKSRGADILISNDLHQKLLGVVSEPFKRFLIAVRESGARPGEVARFTATNIIWEASCCILDEHKTADKTDKPRIILLTPVLLALCKELAAKNPIGPLFLTNRNEPWKKTGWKQAMERAQKKLKLSKRPMTSGYRHTFATDALESGVPDAHLAQLLGHSSTSMIHRHYSHLGDRAKVLAEALNRVRKTG